MVIIMLESKIESKVGDYAKSKNILFEKFTSPNKRSVPDRILTLSNGHIFFIEFKATGEIPTILQSRDHATRRDRGVIVYVCDDVEQGKKMIDDEIWKQKRFEDLLT